MTWTMGTDTRVRGYRYSYNGYGWLTAAEYGEHSDLKTNTNRYTERFLEFMPNGGVRRMQRHGLKANGVYGKVDNLHISYDGNRMSSVLEDAAAVTQNGSMDYPGGNREMSFGYNGWGALVMDESRGIRHILYDRSGNPMRISFTDGSITENVYSESGEKLISRYSGTLTSPMIPDSQTSPVPHLIQTVEYHGNVIYRDGKVDMVLFPGGYATINGSAVTFHYYTQDYLGNNRAVINGSTGAIEQMVAYYPFGGVIADLGMSQTSGQPYRFGGKELITANGLNEYDFGARWYYSAVPFFTKPDPLCEKYYWLSPYLYCMNNPVNAIDPDGRDVYIWATTLPGASKILSPATHTFITVTKSVGNTSYFAYGSEFDGLKGACSGRLCQRAYDQDISIFSGKNKNPDLLKTKILVDVPDGMTQDSGQ